MSTYKTVPRQALSAQPPVHVSPAKARRLEILMRGSTQHAQHGVTQIGFGHDAMNVNDLNDLYPMEISKSIPEEKDIDEYTIMVNNMSMRNRRRSSGQFLPDPSSKHSISGHKRRGNQVPLQSLSSYPNKRHCNTTSNYMNHNDNHSLMVIDDPNSRQSRHMIDMDDTELNQELLSLKHKNSHINEQMVVIRTENDGLNVENAGLREKLRSMEIALTKQMSITEEYETFRERNDRACDSLKSLLNEIAVSEERERSTQLIDDNKLIGRVVQCTSSSVNNFVGPLSDIWEDGQLFEDLKRRRKALSLQKEEIEGKKKELRRLKAKRQKENRNDNNNGFLVPNRPAMNKLCLDSEIISIRLSLIKKQLQELDIEFSTLEYRKKLHIKFIRLMRDEKKSRFCINKKHECYVLNDRYVLTNLLGRGGFSEVHRGYDLIEHKYIAAKIHQLNVQWSDERKKNYTKHATREYDIHKTLNHANIVSLYDVFGIDVNSFCTVLEYCDGMDLDMYLKINKTLQEREARSLIIQVFIGLKYLHNSLPIIIHYDLKPGNLLYKNGEIKLTDFGLAKIVEQESDCIELTSQGAGTYWYLPPECFKNHSNNNPVMISPKVDIWSGGVIFYQMLFGKRPFGDNQSQDSILNNKTILNARSVLFPNQPKNVSKEAKDFIAKCCQYDPKLRLSSNQIVDNHSYFAFLRK